MAEIPSATLTINDQGGAPATGTNYLTLFAPVKTLADGTPRVYGNAAAIIAAHGYNEGAEYAAIHFEETKKPIIFVPLAIITPGATGRKDSSGVTGTSAITLTDGASGCLTEHDGILTVTTGGVIGTDQIKFDLSLDGGLTTKKVRLGTASSYVIPDIDVTISFAGGDLHADDVYTWHGTSPRSDTTTITAARGKLAAQAKLARSWLITYEAQIKADADGVVAQANAYSTSNDRFIYARMNVKDRLPYASVDHSQVRMTGAPNITFAEVGGTGDTITRASGSFIADGFANGDWIRVTGGVAGGGHNNITGKVTNVAASVLTMDSADLDAEGPIAGVAITCEPTLIFADGGATDTCTRSSGSWLADGFRVGDSVTITGTASNNITFTITVLTATVMSTTGAFAAETIGAYSVTMTAGQTQSVWMAAVDALFAALDAEKRISLGAGRLNKLSPITSWRFRRPVSWAASVREYAHDVHIPTFRKSDGPLSGWSLEDNDGNTVEFDERSDSGGLAARFTVARSWSNGPAGAFIALDMTRQTESSLLSRVNNMAVTNVACSTVQATAENAIGAVLVLNADGTATTESLKKIEEMVNSALEMNLLQDKGEGPRASSARWVASTTDILNVVPATMTGVLFLNLNGTLEQINTTVKIQTAG